MPAPLTPREDEVVEMVLEGYSNLNIAMHLGIDELTVKQHLYSAFRKLGVTSRLDMAVTTLKKRHAEEIHRLREEVAENRQSERRG